MEKQPYFISICNQKGGIGKSTFTVLAASLLHYRMGRRVLVVDCDYPQGSIMRQRERELSLLDASDHYKLMMIRQFKATGRKIWPVIECPPTQAMSKAREYIGSCEEPPDYVLFDFPGSTAVKGVMTLVSAMRHVFIPMKACKMVMESSITFARVISRGFADRGDEGVHMFWTMIDRRERTPLYEQYEKVLDMFSIPLMRTHVPLRLNFSKELRPGSGKAYRSTLFAPDNAFAADACLDSLCAEIISITEGVEYGG